ncbi:transposase [Rhizobium laguerreae]|jgi:putative transposase|uniref:transposase n=1 Tax=Rhizobium laguerreae TaxID=1076926 RepID=UPI001C913149|nr:transposase [Rhizobium laguerreae]MBY3425010.1 transposase [Rhizobium laguerreae]
MADEETQIPTDGTVATEIALDGPKKVSRTKKAIPERTRADSSRPAKPKVRGLSDQDKLQKIREIEAQMAGGATLKDAVKSAGISDQTFYLWKKAVVQSVAPISAAPVSVDDELAEFIQLEEENRRLRRLLSEKLRAENANLRKRLGID